jgi:hypothetical protein
LAKIDAFIVPVRHLVEAATGRVVLERRAIHQHNPWMADQLDRAWDTYGHTAGGPVYSLNRSTRRDCCRSSFTSLS